MEHILIEYKQQHTIREKILLWMLGNVIPVHAKFYTRRKPWNLSREDLIKYPRKTLGYELGVFLKEEKLEPVDRVERHDAFHILLGFSTKISDEAAMQFFLIGNGKISPFTIGTAIFAGLMLPDEWGNFRTQYKRGKKTRSIAKWNFKELLPEDFIEVKRIIFNMPADNVSLMNKINQFEKQ